MWNSEIPILRNPVTDTTAEMFYRVKQFPTSFWMSLTPTVILVIHNRTLLQPTFFFFCYRGIRAEWSNGIKKKQKKTTNQTNNNNKMQENTISSVKLDSEKLVNSSVFFQSYSLVSLPSFYDWGRFSLSKDKTKMEITHWSQYCVLPFHNKNDKFLKKPFQALNSFCEQRTK